MAASEFPTLVYVQGSRRPSLTARWNGVDLTGETVTLRIDRGADADLLVKTAAITQVVAQPLSTLLQVTWDATDFDIVGTYEAQFESVDGGGLPMLSDRFRIRVDARIQ